MQFEYFISPNTRTSKMNQQAYFQLIDDLQAIAEELETAPGYDMMEESAPVVGDMDEFDAIWEDR